MGRRWGVAVAAVVAVVVTVAGCTSEGASHGGTRPSGSVSAGVGGPSGAGGSGAGGSGAGGSGAGGSGIGGSGAGGSGAGGSGSPAPGASDSGAGGGSASGDAGDEEVVPSTPQALRAFVLAGTGVDGARYAFSTGAAGDPVRPNRAGDLTFESPSGNISCDLRPAAAGLAPQAVCWVQQLAHTAPRPAGCQHDWAPDVVDVTSGQVHVGACLGGVPFGRYARTLAYGSTLVLGRVGCRSRARFVACADLDTGTGFRADRDDIVAVR